MQASSIGIQIAVKDREGLERFKSVTKYPDKTVSGLKRVSIQPLSKRV